MNCPNCKIKIEGCCSRCGYMVNGISIKEKQSSTLPAEKEIISMYIGNNSGNIYGKINNVSAGIIGPFYFLYRKCYFLGYILLVIHCALLFLLRNIDQRIILSSFIFNFLFYYSFANSIYIKIVRKKIEKIGKGNYDLISKKGGTDIVSPFLAILIIFVFIITYLSYFEYIH